MGLDLTKKINRIVVDGEEAIVVGTPFLQDKEVVPSKESQIVSADSEFDAIKTVTVLPIPDEYIVPEGSLAVTENDTYDVRSLAEIIVNVEGSGGGGGDTLAELLSETLTTYNGSATGIRQYTFYGYTNLISFKNDQIMNGGDVSYTFADCTNLEEMDITIQLNNRSSGNSYCSNTFKYAGSNKPNNNINVKIINNTSLAAYYQNTFQYAKANKVIFENLKSINGSYVTGVFQGATINEVYFNDATSGTVPFQNTSNIFYNAVIERLYFEKLTKIPENFFGYGYGSGLKRIFLGTQCTLANSGYKTVPTQSKIFVPSSALSYYDSATNWTTFFTKDGNTETRMFVYGDFTSGDTLPTQTGTYNITWYEDDNFTTEVSGTATNTARYYGKISAMV